MSSLFILQNDLHTLLTSHCSFVITGIFVSYLPQHYKLIARRSSAGLSPFFVLLGQISTTYAFANILTLPVSRQDMACCGELSGFECFAAVLGILQLGVQWACFTFMWVILTNKQVPFYKGCCAYVVCVCYIDSFSSCSSSPEQAHWNLPRTRLHSRPTKPPFSSPQPAVSMPSLPLSFPSSSSISPLPRYKVTPAPWA